MPGPTEIVTLAEVKRHVNIPADDVSQDDELDLMREAAEGLVEGLIGPVFWRSVTERQRVSGGEVWLSTAPVVSVESLLADGVAVSSYEVDLAFGSVRDISAYGVVTVAYTAGREAVPAAVKLATLLIVKHLWDTQRGNAPSALPDNDTPEFSAEFQSGYAITRRAAELLSPYKLPDAVA